MLTFDNQTESVPMKVYNKKSKEILLCCLTDKEPLVNVVTACVVNSQARFAPPLPAIIRKIPFMPPAKIEQELPPPDAVPVQRLVVLSTRSVKSS